MSLGFWSKWSLFWAEFGGVERRRGQERLLHGRYEMSAGNGTCCHDPLIPLLSLTFR